MAATIICKSSIPWWLSFSVSAGIFLLGLFIIGIVYLVRYLKSKRPRPLKHEIIRRKSRMMGDYDSDDEKFEEEDVAYGSENPLLKLRLWCEKVTSRSTPIGKITCLFQVGLNLFSWGIYIAFSHNQIAEAYLEGDCYLDSMIVLKWIDLGLNIFFALHFILRAFSALDILKFWVLPTTLVDICVIPNIIITSLIDVRRQGMSFLRAIYLRYFVDYILVTFGIMKINSKTQIFITIVYLLSVWMIGSGFIHLLENIGDFWAAVTNKQEWTFWECCYFMLVTVSTVGYGDYSPKTTLGRALICVYIIYAYALFGSSIPQIVYSFKNSKYNEKYITRHGEKHVIVTGILDNSSLKNFLAPFLAKTRDLTKSLKIVIMNKEECDRNMSMYLKTVSSRIKYIMGNAQDSADTERANIRKAKAAVILTTPQMRNGPGDDGENIMTAISLKTQKARIRTIIQLHLYSNKIMLKMFPKWNKYGNDVIICLDEMRLGLMAYNCLVPGISTLITNLICSNELKKRKVQHKFETDWRISYEEGLKNRIHSVNFSDNFHGMPCLEVAAIIYKLFDVVLLAIKYEDKGLESRVIINPAVENVEIDSHNMVALVIARNESSVQRVSFYCPTCSPTNSSKSPNKICKCLINSYKNNMNELSNVRVNNKGSHSNKYLHQKSEAYSYGGSTPNIAITNYVPFVTEVTNSIDIDQSGSFYWTKTPNFNDVCITIEQAESRQFTDHILICLCGDGDGHVDLSNFMMPLRFRALYGDTLRNIVILGSRKYFMENKWVNIRNFPCFTIIDGSPVQSRHLRAAGLAGCFSVAVLNANSCNHDSCDKQTLFCSTLIGSLRSQRKIRSRLVTITEIRNDEIASYLSSMKCHEEDTKLPVDHTEPYARGLLFSNSVLYRCIHSIYYYPEIFSFLTAMLCGPNFNQVEKMFGCGAGLLPSSESDAVDESFACSDMIFKLLPLNKAPFTECPGLDEGSIRYEDLYLWALEEKKILCMGLYRYNLGSKPFVYTNPVKSTDLQITDKVYCCLNNHIVTSEF